MKASFAALLFGIVAVVWSQASVLRQDAQEMSFLVIGALVLSVGDCLWCGCLVLAGTDTLVGTRSALQQLRLCAQFCDGDWGGQPFTSSKSTKGERHCGKSMGVIGAALNSSFTMALGDNFYLLGVDNSHSERFKLTFEDVFTAESLQRPWFVLAGNHDHYGNVTAQVEYTHLSDRWTFPSLYYSHKHTVPGTSTTVEVVMIDTVVLAGLGSGMDEDFSASGPGHGVSESPEKAREHLAWLEHTLSSSTADWLFVAGHYPVYSAAEHGPTAELVANVLPLLKKYKVDAYYAGHDHSLQHIDVDGIDYIISGAGHDTFPSTKHLKSLPPGSCKFHYAKGPLGVLASYSYGGFMSTSVSETQTVFRYYDMDGKQLFETVRYRQRNL